MALFTLFKLSNSGFYTISDDKARRTHAQYSGRNRALRAGMNMHIRLLHTLQAELQFSHPHSIKKGECICTRPRSQRLITSCRPFRPFRLPELPVQPEYLL